MRAEAFRAALINRIGKGSVSSYLAYARRAEQVLKFDLDDVGLSDDDLATVGVRLTAASVPARSVRNILSALRAYATFREGSRLPRRPPESKDSHLHQPVAPVLVADVPPEPGSVADLLSRYGEIMDELRARQIVRTGNSPVGDYAEKLFEQAFGWELEGNSSAGFDAVDCNVRYQIKGRRLGTPTASRQLGAIRRLDLKPFDFLAAVLFDARFRIVRGIIMPHNLVQRHARFAAHTNSWTLLLEDRLWQEAGVKDVTADLAVAAAEL